MLVFSKNPMLVPNEFPTLPSSKRLAIIGEAPGQNEDRIGRPFVGEAGRILDELLSLVGLPRSSVFVGNVCQIRPPNNYIPAFSWFGPEITAGVTQLQKDLELFNPNICVLLGNIPTKLAKDYERPHPLVPQAFRYKVGNWRGSLFLGDRGPLSGRKCISTYHPASILRQYANKPLLHFDLLRAVDEASDPTLVLPVRTIRVPSTADEAVASLRNYRLDAKLTATDIEGWWNWLVCISFANDPLVGTVIPFFRKNGSPYWANPRDGARVWRAVAELLEDPKVPKILQNSLYDRFALHYGHRIRVRNVREDTMLKFWELYSQLKKSLAMQVSLLTREPYYKGDRKTQDDVVFWRYSALDSCCTLEVCQVLEKALQSKQYHRSEQARAKGRQHYRMNRDLLNPLLNMELRGMLYDVEKAAKRRAGLRVRLFELQAKLNGLTGRYLQPKSTGELMFRAREQMLTKDGKRPYKDEQQNWLQFNYLLRQRNPTLATIGEIENLLGVSLNTDSADQMRAFLYEELQLPPQYKENDDGEKVLTADYEALLKLSKHLQRTNDPRVEIIQTAIDIRALDTRQQMLAISADRDGRIRCTYNIVGSYTGRVQCGKSPTGSGYNLQTIPNYTNPTEAPGAVLGDRDLFLADPDCWFFQCDLKGADGWSVAAYSAMLGDRTMLEDYLAGISPFDILTLRLRGVAGNYNDREWLKAARKQVKKDDWDRFAMKRVQHGASYLEGGLTISNNILKDSEGKMFMEPTECQRIRDELFFGRYPGIRRWHDWVAARLRERPELVAASGQVCKFFGRRQDMITKAVAFEPQANTTYATNRAMYRLWTDSENRLSTASTGGECEVQYQWDVRASRLIKILTPRVAVAPRLRVQPLHQVHDALCGQFRKEDTAWAVAKIKSWFNNPLIIAGQQINIPFDGTYGPSWGQQDEGKI